jgi:hypothetical protein
VSLAAQAELLGITVSGLVYVVVLAPTDHPQGLQAWTNMGEHYISPVLTVLGRLLFGPRPRITAAVVGRALLWPVAWIGYAVALRNLALVVLVALVFLLAFWLVDRKPPATWRPWSPHHRRPRRLNPEQAASADRPT